MTEEEAVKTAKIFANSYLTLENNNYHLSRNFKKGMSTVSFLKTTETVIATLVVLIVVPITIMGFLGLFGFLLL
jgi:preprotein translocase subunit SecE